MSFEAKTIFESDFSESAERFSSDLAWELKDKKLHISSLKLYEDKWQEVIDQGWQNCLIPEEYGGLGGNLVDFSSLIEGSSRHALGLPITSGFGLPVVTLLALNDPKAVTFLRKIAQGSVRFQPVFFDRIANDLSSAPDTLRAHSDAAGGVVLDGHISGVEWIPCATHLLVLCPFEHNQQSYVIVSLAIDETIEKCSYAARIDGRSTITLTFNNHRIESIDLLAMADSARKAVDRVMNAGCLFGCVSAAAAMGMSIEKTIEYLRDRQQFGVSLSTFQALRHYMAQVYAKYECYRALVKTLVIASVASDEIDEQELSLLKVYLGQVGQFVAHTVLQVHGGMGMTEDLFASKLNKIVLMASMEYGDRHHHVDAVISGRDCATFLETA